MQTKCAIATIALLIAPAVANADETQASIDDQREVGVLAGLLQPAFARGGNLQLEIVRGRIVFDYSHGWALKPPSVGDMKDQELATRLPYTTGFGIGYRFTEDVDLRLEPKLHKFDVHYDDDSFTADNKVVGYRTVTIGVGAYYKYRPFSRGPAKGVTLAASARVWPNVWSSLDDDSHSYDNERTGREERHESSNIGFANTPFIVNVSVGYVFAL